MPIRFRIFRVWCFLILIGLGCLVCLGCGGAGGGEPDGGAADGQVDDGGQDAGADGEADAGSDGGDAGDPDAGDEEAVLEAIALSPASLEVEEGMTRRVSASGSYSDGQERDVTAEVSWLLEPNAPVEIATGLLTALRPGQTTVRARIGAIVSDDLAVTVQPHAAYEARGLWVTRWNCASAEDVRRIVAAAAAAGFNQLYFQVRGTADAYYASSVEPWAAGLSGALGRDPGWDPLQVALDEAHGAGMELHAWINTVPAWSCALDAPVSEGIPHVLELHPEWSAADANGIPMLGNCADGYVFLSPGNPAVHDHIRAVIQDLVSAYDLDGVHLDYIRYPGTRFSHDPVSEQRYAEAVAAEPGLAWEDWQRRQINALVGGVYETLATHRPEAVLSAAVWFIRINVWGWSAVSEGFHQYFQDPRAWCQAGTIDAIVPMIYFGLTDPPGGRLDFASMLQDHLDGAAGRHVYAGIHGDYDDFGEIAAQFNASRQLGARGMVIFAYPYLVEHAYFDDLAEGPLAEPVLGTPGMPWR